jgi:UDP:flavonoid glycosyltransferase YjiC (YdhE family)
MARILMTWELGMGLGHLNKLVALADPLKSAKHDIVFAVRDPGYAAPILDRAGMRFYQCPINPQTLPPSVKFCSLPQILLGLGYTTVTSLKGRLDAWRAFYDLLKPDVLVCDASPTALLASRGLNMHTLSVGTGFFIPPDISPLPNLRPWLKIETAILAEQESQLLENINAALGQYTDAQPLRNVSQAFAADKQVLMTVKDLDIYASLRNTTNQTYWGPVPAPEGIKPEWPSTKGKRVFVYLRRFGTLPALLETLKDSHQPTLLYISDLPADVRRNYACESLRFAAQPLDMETVAQQCDLAIVHGGHGASAAMLLAGKPLLLLPVHLEMLLNAQAVTRLGAGLTAPQLKAGGMQDKFQQLLDKPEFSAAAQAFARRYARLAIKSIPKRFGQLVEALLAA